MSSGPQPPADDDDETPLEQLVGGVVIGGILLTAFTLLALDFPWFWVAFPVGFAGVLPAAIALVRLYERRQEGSANGTGTTTRGNDEALAALRDRYARGEMTDEEFERRVERLIETESTSNAEAYLERTRREAAAGGDGATDRTAEFERERERE